MVIISQLLNDLQGFSIGSSGIRFLHEAEFDHGQRGYSVGSNGEALSGLEVGQWRQTLQVIGCDESCGDPIFVDTGSTDLPVYTAAHGTGSWDPVKVAKTIGGFRQSINIMAQLAAGRENPVKLRNNPIDQTQREEVLQEIGSLNDSVDIDMEFWDLIMGFY